MILNAVKWKLQGNPVDGQYEVIYADPPWSYNDHGCNGAAAAHYSTMSTADIGKIPVGQLAAKDAVLFMWATYPKLPDALDLIKAWGFTFKSIAFQWVKIYPSGQPRFGLGRWTRGNTEPCLLAVKGKPKRLDNAVSQLIFSEELIVAPIGRHSAKPPETRERILRLMGDLPAVELFAREKVPNWDCFGDQAEGSLTYE
jgi:N6-adenosine-specific RNA methylase IME4